MSAHSTNVVEKTLEALDDPKLVARVLELVDAHFRGIPSLREISVDVYEVSERSDVRLKMESHGWVINVIELTEGLYSKRSFGSYDEEDYNFYDNNYDDDNDYKNDSDYWRRQSD